jgi:hypothetical protein
MLSIAPYIPMWFKFFNSNLFISWLYMHQNQAYTQGNAPENCHKPVRQLSGFVANLSRNI